MKKFKGISMVTGKVDKNGVLVTREAIDKALKGFAICSIGYEFNPSIPPVGKITKALLVGENLEVEGEIKESFGGKYAIVPSFEARDKYVEDGIIIIDSLDFISFSLTSQPADEDVTIFDI